MHQCLWRAITVHRKRARPGSRDVFVIVCQQVIASRGVNGVMKRRIARGLRIEAVIDCGEVRMAGWYVKGRMYYQRGTLAYGSNTGLILSNAEVQRDGLFSPSEREEPPKRRQLQLRRVVVAMYDMTVGTERDS
jgi:hypothetical protein